MEFDVVTLTWVVRFFIVACALWSMRLDRDRCIKRCPRRSWANIAIEILRELLAELF